MTSNPVLSYDVLEQAHVGGFAGVPYRPSASNSTVRIVLVGIAGPPERWKPIYSSLEEVCRPMLFPFSPDQPEKDKTVAANVVEYADVASDLKGNVIAGEPTMVFCLPGIDRNRRIGILAEVLPKALSHHNLYGSLLYSGEDVSELFPGIIEAKTRGFQTHEVEQTMGDLDKEAFQRWWAQWLISLDPTTQQ